MVEKSKNLTLTNPQLVQQELHLSGFTYQQIVMLSQESASEGIRNRASKIVNLCNQIASQSSLGDKLSRLSFELRTLGIDIKTQGLNPDPISFSLNSPNGRRSHARKGCC
jgi:hypothetical protein